MEIASKCHAKFNQSIDCEKKSIQINGLGQSVDDQNEKSPGVLGFSIALKLKK